METFVFICITGILMTISLYYSVVNSGLKNKINSLDSMNYLKEERLAKLVKRLNNASVDKQNLIELNRIAERKLADWQKSKQDFVVELEKDLKLLSDEYEKKENQCSLLEKAHQEVIDQLYEKKDRINFLESWNEVRGALMEKKDATIKSHFNTIVEWKKVCVKQKEQIDEMEKLIFAKKKKK